MSAGESEGVRIRTAKQPGTRNVEAPRSAPIGSSTGGRDEAARLRRDLWHSLAMVGRALAVAMTLVLACGDDDVTGDAGAPCASAADCDDGVFCNGAEACRPGGADADGRGCTPGSAPCGPGAACMEAARSCGEPCSDPDSDGDGVDAVECGGDDCDDTDPLRAPGLTEVCDEAGRDEDCDPTTFGARDADGDGAFDARCCNGAACGTDCDDARAGIHPSAGEVCDELDNDCDGDADEGLLQSAFEDADRDLHGNPDRPLLACPGQAGTSLSSLDCDDTDPTVNGPQGEILDGIDNDCDGTVDEEIVVSSWYVDMDGDGYGDPSGDRVDAEAPPDGYGLLPIDCDDSTAEIRPGATERCNGVDDDCDGVADFAIGVNDYEDDDGDGYADAACGGDDCDDRAPGRHPDAMELCNGADDDCDGATDESCGPPDAGVDGGQADGGRDAECDMDGDSVFSMACGGLDCDDTNPDRRPGAAEVCDALDTDEDCNLSTTGRDVDGDGADDAGCCNGARCGTDCDDLDERVRPGAAEACNGVDDDCDGSVDEGVGGCAAPRLVALGQEMSCATTDSGALYCWGHNFNGSLGVGAGGGFFPSPADVTSVDFAALSVEGMFGASCGAAESGGAVYCWGRNTNGSLGVGDESMRTLPTEVPLSGVRTIGSAGSHVCALTEGGDIYCWGSNTGGQLGFRGGDRNTPTRVLAWSKWDELVVLGLGGCARRAGEVWCWGGFSEGGQDAAPIEGTRRWSAMVGSDDLCLIDESRELYCWVPRTRRVNRVSGAPANVRWGETGGTVRCVLAGAQLYCEGDDDEGQLGDGPGDTGAGSWVVPAGGRSWVRASVGDRHVCAVDDTGTLHCWGRDIEGQLGDGTLASPDARFSPFPVAL